MSIAPGTLRHQYVICRHGKSVANDQKIIVSSLISGCSSQYSLTRAGEDQCQQAAQELAAHLSTTGQPQILLLTSPFSRASATAKIFHAHFSTVPEICPRLICHGAPDVAIQLRERYFGAFELQGDSNYDVVWARDSSEGPRHQERGSESVLSVWLRLLDLVLLLERRLTLPTVIVLFSHGDTLQILQTGFSGRPLESHRSLPHLNQAEWRVLNGAFEVQSRL